MRLSPVGNLIIGETADSSFRLEVANYGLGPAANSRILGGRFTTTSSNADHLEIVNMRGQSGGADWTTAGWRLQQRVDSTWMGYIQFNGSSSNVGIGTTNNNGITFGAGSAAGTNPNGVPEVMRITSVGRVGIGTASPQGNLHVMGNVVLQTSGSSIGGIRFPDGSFLTSASNLVINAAAVTSNVTVTAVSTNATFFPTFVDASSGNLGIRVDTSYTFNASNEHLTAGAFIPINATPPANGMFLPSSNIVAISTNSSEKLRVLSDGTVQIGFTGTSLGYRLHVNGSALVSSGLQVKPNTSTSNSLTFESFDSLGTDMRLMWFYQLGGSSQYMRLSSGVLEFRNDSQNIEVSIAQNGALSAVGEITAFSSDRRLKTNIRPIPGALEKVSSLTGVLFRWKDEVDSLGFSPTKKDDVGVIAQDVESVLPEAVRPAPFDVEGGVSKTGENYLTVQYEKLTALLIEAVKELASRVEKLERGSGD